MADSGWRHAKFLSRQFEAHVPRGSFKSAKSDQGWQASHKYILDEMNSSAAKFFEFALARAWEFDRSPKRGMETQNHDQPRHGL